jgi:ATP-binding cassette subfamily B protein
MTGAWAAHESEASTVGFWTAARAVPRLTGYALRTAWSADRWALLVSGAAHLAQAAFAAASLLAINEVLVQVLAAIPTTERLWQAAPSLIVAAVLAAGAALTRACATAAGGRLAPKVQRVAEQALLERASRVELAVLEDGDFQRSLAGARLGVRATEQLLAGVLAGISALFTLVAMMGVVTVLHPVLIVLLSLAVVPDAWKAVVVAGREYASTMRWLNHSRQKDLLADLLMERGAAAEEIRVHGLAGFLLGHYRRLAVALEGERARLAKQHAVLDLVARAVGAVANALVFVGLGYLLLSGTVPIATAGTAVYAITRATGQLSALLVRFRDLYSHSLFVADYTQTLHRATDAAIAAGGRPMPVPIGRIAVSGVTFTYPDRSRPAVTGVHLDLRRGEVVALVGANGSGKTTLAKLIAGLYSPQQGTITWDGVDVRDLDRDSVFARVAWIGQDFRRWPFTARANIALGRPSAFTDTARLTHAARFSGADQVVTGLAEQWDTLLAREFQGGSNLSGGQWQRLALARGHFRHAEILVCDEPTAALDPLTEIAAFQALMSLTGDRRTVVLISHRLGSIRHAQHIYVMDDGHIAEHGTHDELISAEGLYARMYQAQRHQYELARPSFVRSAQDRGSIVDIVASNGHEATTLTKLPGS